MKTLHTCRFAPRASCRAPAAHDGGVREGNPPAPTAPQEKFFLKLPFAKGKFHKAPCRVTDSDACKSMKKARNAREPRHRTSRTIMRKATEPKYARIRAGFELKFRSTYTWYPSPNGATREQK